MPKHLQGGPVARSGSRAAIGGSLCPPSTS